MFDVRDVWPENYSTNSVQKVWAAKFAARHPNIAVLDLSSFKCGNDAPIYGMIDDIIGATNTPYLALHDLDANKPSGSIKLRVKTYAYALSLYREHLEDTAERRKKFEKNIAAKRATLVANYRETLESRIHAVGPGTWQAVEAAFESYLDADNTRDDEDDVIASPGNGNGSDNGKTEQPDGHEGHPVSPTARKDRTEDAAQAWT